MPARKQPGRSELDDMNVPGNDEFDGEDQVVALNEHGAAVIRPKSFDRLPPRALELANQLMGLVAHRRFLAQHIDELVPRARDLGLSWGQIGWCVGTSGQAAQQRWGDVDE